MSIEESLAIIKEYDELFEKEKDSMTELEKLLLSPSALNTCAMLLMAIQIRKDKYEQVSSN